MVNSIYNDKKTASLATILSLAFVFLLLFPLFFYFLFLLQHTGDFAQEILLNTSPARTRGHACADAPARTHTQPPVNF